MAKEETEMNFLWTIMIATTVDRRKMFEELYKTLSAQAAGKPVEIIYEEDNKEISIGKKRQILLDRAQGEYVCFFDSDDMPYPDYVDSILDALSDKPDCVGFLIAMTTNNLNPQTCCHSLSYPEWKEKVDGYDYVRNVTHFNPVRRDLAKQIGFSDKRYGEDKEYSDKVTKLCWRENFIGRHLFHYNYSTKMPFKKKYGYER